MHATVHLIVCGAEGSRDGGGSGSGEWNIIRYFAIVRELNDSRRGACAIGCRCARIRRAIDGGESDNLAETNCRALPERDSLHLVNQRVSAHWCLHKWRRKLRARSAAVAGKVEVHHVSRRLAKHSIEELHLRGDARLIQMDGIGATVDRA